MNFQTLQKIENYQFYIERAFQVTKKSMDRIHQMKKPKMKDAEHKRRYAQYVESERIKEFSKEVASQLKRVHEKFPGLDGLPPFYNELARVTIRYNYTKKGLGAINAAERACKEVERKAVTEMKIARSYDLMQNIRKKFYGRITALLRQMNESFQVIEESRRVMKTWPDIKPEIRTIAIAGYPNVGKSSLLKALTGANPDIQAYAFTTKSLNVGYMNVEPRTYQLVDTPGTFDRDVEDMNNVEKQAYVVLKHLAEKVIYVFDASESCGYEVEKQIKLAKRIKEFDRPIIFVVNKMDLDMTKLDKITKEFPDAALISIKEQRGIEALKKSITKLEKKK
ncbi:50S ribosome-binding GTPase [Candidatus Woesearchaeota archaeon]|nr:50S ribosome-binding GTPase [Candidatus Woesearchaeota archaeon]